MSSSFSSQTLSQLAWWTTSHHILGHMPGCVCGMRSFVHLASLVPWVVDPPIRPETIGESSRSPVRYCLNCRQCAIADTLPIHSYVSLYSLGQGGIVIFLSVSYLIYVLGALRAARIIHSKLITSVFGATLRCVYCSKEYRFTIDQWDRWLDTTPASRIITRCTQDIQASTLTRGFIYR